MKGIQKGNSMDPRKISSKESAILSEIQLD